MNRTLICIIGATACAAVLILTLPHPDPDLLPVEPYPAGGDDEYLSLQARVLAKEYVASEMTAGRLTFPEAASVFLWLNRQPPVPVAMPRQGEGEEEYACRTVTEFRGIGVRAPAASATYSETEAV